MKKSFIITVSILVILASIYFGINYIITQNNLKKEKAEELEVATKIKKIKNHYNTYVVTNSKTNLYKKEDNNYNTYGEINEGVKLVLGDITIDENTKYFYLSELDLYIEYDKVTPTDEFIYSDRYKNYIYFNTNITTKNPTIFYDEEGNYLYKLNNSYDFKVIVKDTNNYGVEFNNQLLYIREDSIDKIYDNQNTSEKNKDKIRTLTYHFLYDSETETCNELICQSLNLFESHLKYIRENDYFTLKLNELELYLDGKINIPQKSIVLTVDDGTTFNPKAIDLLEQYKVNATLFVVTSWIDPSNLKSNYLDLESHTDNMHTQYVCPGMGEQGGGILCLPEDEVLNDLKTSQEKLGGSKYLAYPFFDFNARAIELLKKAGFHMAFIGQYDSNGYSYPLKTDKFKVRRMTIFSDITEQEFIEYLN